MARSCICFHCVGFVFEIPFCRTEYSFINIASVDPETFK